MKKSRFSLVWRLAGFVNTKTGTIWISPQISKVRDQRRIEIQPNLQTWLTKYPPEVTRLVPASPTDSYSKVRKGFSIPYDGLRHSFISYHVAKFRSIGNASLEAGNSERIIRKHYLDLVDRETAEEFWQIRPMGSGERVVKFERLPQATGNRTRKPA